MILGEINYLIGKSGVILDKSKKMSLTYDRPLYIHTDGEIFSGFGTDVKQIYFEILPEAMQVVRPS
jgi:diacylglycerol kinase family enzyme